MHPIDKDVIEIPDYMDDMFSWDDGYELVQGET